MYRYLFFINRFSHVIFIILIISISSCGNKKKTGSEAVEAKDALSTFQVADGFKIEMIASEPLISDPVDMEIDEYGRMYVVEMHGYPLDRSGSCKIILLADTNGDGVMDKRTVFAEGLDLPNSIMRWKKGVLVTDAPNLLYLEDTNGDGKADIKDTVLAGFALSNPQHNVNSPVYGLDNWIYIAHEGSVSTQKYKEDFGDEGSEIIFPSLPNSPRLPKNANGLSIRVRPDQQQIEMTSSRCQFGQTFDEWGHWFGCDNSNQGYQEVIANRYFKRNPALPVSDGVQNMSDHLNAPEVFPTTTHPDRQLLTDVGVMTSGCGLTHYSGGAFPSPYNKNVTFIAEPVSNLVHVDLLRDTGTSFIASRILEHKEFLSSTDAWARPVNFYIGPDGALYMLDYYRRVIESPEWMSDEAIAEGGLYDGSDKGRIYRITPKNGAPAEWIKGLKLGDASNDELVAYLADKNSWWRMNAQRLLVDRSDKRSVPALTRMAADTYSELGRLHALWTLEGMGALEPSVIIKALKDPVAGIRENAIRLAELHLQSAPQLSDALLLLQTDPNPKVRFQLLLTLGFVNSPQAKAARNKLLFTDINDKWVQIAALSASSTQTASLLQVVLDKFDDKVPAYASLVQRLTNMVGAGDDIAPIHSLIQRAITVKGKEQAWQSSILKGLSQGMRNQKEKLTISETDQRSLIKTFFETPSEKLRRASLQLLQVNGISNGSLKETSIARAVQIIRDTTMQDEKGADAIDFLTLGDPSPHVPLLEKLLVPEEKPVVQLATLKTLSRVPTNAVSEYLIQQWPVLTAEIRESAIGVLMQNEERIALLINALEKGTILTSSVSFSRSVALMMTKDKELRKRARNLFTKNEQQAKEINKQYQAALELTGDPLKGRQVYNQNCAMCHQVRGKSGVSFGPDLGTIHNWKKEDIMANILDPSLSISAGYELWEVELNSGESVQGIMASETPSAITLKNNGKADRTINRQEIKSLKSLSISAMTSGLEKNIDKQQMADLLSFLRQN